MTDRITFTLDGREVEAEAGESIWEVAKRQGTLIPHLCHKDEPCLLYTSPSPRDQRGSRMPSSA